MSKPTYAPKSCAVVLMAISFLVAWVPLLCAIWYLCTGIWF